MAAYNIIVKLLASALERLDKMDVKHKDWTPVLKRAIEVKRNLMILRFTLDSKSFSEQKERDLSEICTMFGISLGVLIPGEVDTGIYDRVSDVPIIQYERMELFCTIMRIDMEGGRQLGPHVSEMMGMYRQLEAYGYPLTTEFELAITLMHIPSLGFDVDEPTRQPRLLGKSDTTNAPLGVCSASSTIVKRRNKDELMLARNSCYHCGKFGHKIRNCAEHKRAIREQKSGIFVIEAHFTTSSSWVLDTGCGFHICKNVQAMQKRRKLGRGGVDLRVGNGAKVAAYSEGSIVLNLPSSLELILNNVIYVPAISRNIISVSRLNKDGYSVSFNSTFLLIG